MSMDVISYGVANKAASDQRKTRDTTLGAGVEGQAHNLKERIDLVEKYIQGVVRLADSVIVKDAINIMKANAKLNAIAKSKRYKLANMIFEDFLDGGGIDASKSNGYALDTTNGLVKASGGSSYTVVTTVELTDAVPDKALLVVEEYGPQYTDNIIPKMTRASPGATYGVSSDQYGKYTSICGNYNSSWLSYGYYAFDQDIGTYWVPAGGTSDPKGWVGVQLETPRIIKKYAIQAHNPTLNNAPACGPKTWTFEGSNDGNTWTVLHSGSKGSWSFGERAEFLVDNNTPYTRYRINVTAFTAYMTIISGLEMMEGANSTEKLGKYSISRDDGVTWEEIKPESLFYFSTLSPASKSIRLKAELPANCQLLNYGLTWS